MDISFPINGLDLPPARTVLRLYHSEVLREQFKSLLEPRQPDGFTYIESQEAGHFPWKTLPYIRSTQPEYPERPFRVRALPPKQMSAGKRAGEELGDPWHLLGYLSAIGPVPIVLCAPQFHMLIGEKDPYCMLWAAPHFGTSRQGPWGIYLVRRLSQSPVVRAWAHIAHPIVAMPG